MNRTLGQVAYESYHSGEGNGRTIVARSTTPVPPYEALSTAAKAMWEGVAAAVQAALIPGVGKGSAWVGVDFDGTLAEYLGGSSHNELGRPIMPVVNHVLNLLNAGTKVKICTARVSPVTDLMGNVVENSEERAKIEQWCVKHLGRKLEITCCKDYGMIELIDDRAVQVVPNRGVRVDNKHW